MRLLSRLALGLGSLLLVAGCASTEVTSRQEYTGGPIPRPARIIVYDFAASAADIPAGSFVNPGQYAQPAIPPTAQESETVRKLGAEVAKSLVEEIQAMGLPAVRAAGQPAPRPGEIVIMGYFESINQGDMAKRLVLGFGSGAASLRTSVEGYLMTSRGLQRLGSGQIDSEGGKAPGLAIPIAMAAATANPIGLAISGAAKIEGEASGRTTIEGAGKRTAKQIADALRGAFQRQGWI